LEQSIKQRIVGIAVLLIAAVVLLPALFDGEGSYPLPLESRIPAPAPFPDAPRAVPERPVVTADSADIRIATNPTLQAIEEDVPEPVAQEQIAQDAAADATSDDIRPSEPLAPEAPANDTPSLAPAAPEQTPAAAIPEPAADATPDATPRPAASAPASLDSTGLPQGWSVRLASFSNQTNARNLVERLQTNGHRAYMREVTSSQGPLTAVYVGPDVDRAAAQRLREQLQREYDLAGIVVRYEIEEL